MIQLFNINDYVIVTSRFDHHLHGSVVTEFEKEFAKYVGAKYALAMNSATNAIEVIASFSSEDVISVPAMIPPVVVNALVAADYEVKHTDDVDWIGHDYHLTTIDSVDKGTIKVYDSAQRVDRDQYKEYASGDVAIFSFYPTKPVGSFDGGMIVSDNRDLIDALRVIVNNGMHGKGASWDKKWRGYGKKAYMNSIQAHVALQNLRKLDDKKEKLSKVRKIYNHAFDLSNTSDHLYRVTVLDNDKAIEGLKADGISCGIHYRSLDLNCPESVKLSKHTLSIPFHEKLTTEEINKVIHHVNKYYIKLS